MGLVAQVQQVEGVGGNGLPSACPRRLGAAFGQHSGRCAPSWQKGDSDGSKQMQHKRSGCVRHQLQLQQVCDGGVPHPMDSHASTDRWTPPANICLFAAAAALPIAANSAKLSNRLAPPSLTCRTQMVPQVEEVRALLPQRPRLRGGAALQ